MTDRDQPVSPAPAAPQPPLTDQPPGQEQVAPIIRRPVKFTVRHIGRSTIQDIDMAQPGDGVYIPQHDAAVDPIKLAREALSITMAREGLELGLAYVRKYEPVGLNGEAQILAALAALDAIPQPAPPICERCAAIRADALSDMAATDAAVLDAMCFGTRVVERKADGTLQHVELQDFQVPAPVPGDAELDALQARLLNKYPISDNDRKTAAALSALRTRLAEVARDKAAADKIMGEIEARFPDWKSYRDLLDCIDCTLHQKGRKIAHLDHCAIGGVSADATLIAALVVAGATLQARVEKAEALIYSPGSWCCPKCKFSLQQMTMNQSGEVAAQDKPGEPCPNCDTPLWRVTWKQAAEENLDCGIKEMKRADVAEADLKKASRQTLKLQASLWSIAHAAGCETREDLMRAAGDALDPDATAALDAYGARLRAEGREAGIKEAVAFVTKRREAYVQEHGSYDHTTGVTEFPGDGDETVGDWLEIEEGILALIEAKGSAANG